MGASIIGVLGGVHFGTEVAKSGGETSLGPLVDLSAGPAFGFTYGGPGCYFGSPPDQYFGSAPGCHGFAVSVIPQIFVRGSTITGFDSPDLNWKGTIGGKLTLAPGEIGDGNMMPFVSLLGGLSAYTESCGA
ncbi:MAG: hypothetical protein HYU99_09055, partial [Deltaproteobacteria bacterium]|nr:hypothetical protein [Deltaproteobacteria bacterium]